MNPVCRQVQKDFLQNEAVCAKTLTLFHLISNKARFRIICLLARGEFCVNDIVEAVGHGKLSNISQQLRMLTLAGLIQRRRDAKRVLYSLKDPRVARTISFLREQFLDPSESNHEETPDSRRRHRRHHDGQSPPQETAGDGMVPDRRG